jgi:hypothetical protein
MQQATMPVAVVRMSSEDAKKSIEPKKEETTVQLL